MGWWKVTKWPECCYITSIGLVNRSFVVSGEFLFFPRWHGGTKLQRLTYDILLKLIFSDTFTHYPIIHFPFTWTSWRFLELLVSHKPKLTPWIPQKKTKSVFSFFKWNVVIFFSKGGILQVPCGSHEQKPHMNHKVLVGWYGWLTGTL